MASSAASKACDTCRSIFVNPQVPSVFMDGKWTENKPWLWRKTARELQESIAEGCLMCYSLRHRFEVDYLDSALYKATGDVHLNMAYMEVGYPMLGIWPIDPSAGHNCWLSYKLAAVSGKSFRCKNCVMDNCTFDVSNYMHKQTVTLRRKLFRAVGSKDSSHPTYISGL
jgi:hypothetical protein